MSDLDQRTPAEKAALHAAEIRIAEATLPVPLRNPDGITCNVRPSRVEALLAAGWTR